MKLWKKLGVCDRDFHNRVACRAAVYGDSVPSNGRSIGIVYASNVYSLRLRKKLCS